MAEYTKPELRERLRQEIQDGDRGGKPGQWSARKAQLLVQEYERAGGGYKGEKDERQQHLEEWGEQEWEHRGGERYLPKAAWDQLSPEERKATNKAKREADGQFAANTPEAKAARKAAEHVEDLTVADAKELLPALPDKQLERALHRERDGRARKTLVSAMEAELKRR